MYHGKKKKRDDDAADLRRTLLAEMCEKKPELFQELDMARGPCLRFQGKQPGCKRLCNKGDKCPFLHVHAGQELALAQNRLQHPFLQMTGDSKLLLIPPLKQAVEFWWSHTLGRQLLVLSLP